MLCAMYIEIGTVCIVNIVASWKGIHYRHIVPRYVCSDRTESSYSSVRDACPSISRCQRQDPLHNSTKLDTMLHACAHK
jgi:hypothetical protein